MKYNNSAEFGNKAANVGGRLPGGWAEVKRSTFWAGPDSLSCCGLREPHASCSSQRCSPPISGLPPVLWCFMSTGNITPTFPWPCSPGVSGTVLNASGGAMGPQWLRLLWTWELLSQVDLCAFPCQDWPIHERKLKCDVFPSRPNLQW